VPDSVPLGSEVCDLCEGKGWEESAGANRACGREPHVAEVLAKAGDSESFSEQVLVTFPLDSSFCRPGFGGVPRAGGISVEEPLHGRARSQFHLVVRGFSPTKSDSCKEGLLSKSPRRSWPDEGN
jgi:hypothetical protein